MDAVGQPPSQSHVESAVAQERYEVLVEVQAVNARLRSVASLAVVDFSRRRYLAAALGEPAANLTLFPGGRGR